MSPLRLLPSLPPGPRQEQAAQTFPSLLSPRLIRPPQPPPLLPICHGELKTEEWARGRNRRRPYAPLLLPGVAAMETGERMALPSVFPPPRTLRRGREKEGRVPFPSCGRRTGEGREGECALDPSPSPSLEAGKTTQKGRHIGEKEGGRAREREGRSAAQLRTCPSFSRSLECLPSEGKEGGRNCCSLASWKAPSEVRASPHSGSAPLWNYVRTCTSFYGSAGWKTVSSCRIHGRNNLPCTVTQTETKGRKEAPKEWGKCNSASQERTF